MKCLTNLWYKTKASLPTDKGTWEGISKQMQPGNNVLGFSEGKKKKKRLTSSMTNVNLIVGLQARQD